MNKNLFAIALLVLATAFATTSCNKDEDPKTNAELILGSWKVTAASVSPEIPIVGTDVYSYLYEECDKDDISIFEDNGVLKIDEGASKCNANDPQTVTGTYLFNPTQTVITINDGSGPESFNVVELGESVMRISYSENVAGTDYTYTVTFTKQ
ncbi:MAG: hypothetical protein R2879_20585 [Saprospiraceae bacterium]